MDLPGVRVNALALRNLSALPFVQLRATGRGAPPALAARARWLAHGLGPAAALTAAATAALAESVPAALVSPVRRPVPAAPRKDGGGSSAAAAAAAAATAAAAAPPPAIWVFGADGDIAAAAELVGDAFAETQSGVWTARAPRATTDALFDAVSRAVVAALEADGAVRVGPDVVHPATALAYRFRLGIARAPAPTVVLRVAVHRADIRFVDDDDTAAVLAALAPGAAKPGTGGSSSSGGGSGSGGGGGSGSGPLRVVASPLALRATLSRRRLAGDALSASVLARWREAGLLPAGPLKDSAVVFLDLGRGLQVPFPRACVLTAAKKGPLRPARPAARGRDRVPKPDPLFRSRKRPRSPSAKVEDRAGAGAAQPPPPAPAPAPAQKPSAKPARAAQKHEPVPVVDGGALGMTAAAFNAALADAGRKGLVDQYPTLKHPFARNPPRPLPLQEQGAPAKNEEKIKTEPANLTPDPGSQERSAGLLTATEIPTPGFSSKNDLDMFGLMGSRADTAGDQSMMPNIDMSDFGTLDDDVASFFVGFDNIAPAPSPQIPGSASAAGAKASAKHVKKSGAGPSSNPRPSSAGPGSAGLEKSKKKDLGVGSKTIGKKKPGTSAGIVAKVLQTFASIPSPKDRPSAADQDKALGAFLEEDRTKKMTEYLVAGLKPSQRCAQKIICPINSQYMPSYTKYGSIEGVRSLLTASAKPKGATDSKLKTLRHLYVPSRRLAAYARMCRKNKSPSQRARAMLGRHSRSDGSSDEESDSESDCEMIKRDKSISRYQQKIEAETNKLSRENAAASSNPALKMTEATKVAQTVAVDCASACLVLIEEYQRSTAASVSASPRTLALSGGLSAGSGGNTVSGSAQNGNLDTEQKSPALTAAAAPGAIGMSPSTSSLVPSPRISTPHNNVPRTYASQNAMLTNSRISQRKERDSNTFLSFLALLQMQALTAEVLHLFNVSASQSLSGQGPSEAKPPKDNGASGNLTYKAIDTVPASSAVLRRVLHGLPRTIECSKALRSYTMNENTNHGEASLCVEGPLSISELYGDSTIIQSLPSPQVCVGYSGDWVETDSNVLPLWEKAGLEPYSKRKDVEYAVLAPKTVEQNTKVFFRDLSAAYEECCFGKHTVMPFDSMQWIANSRSSSKSQVLKPSDVSPEESAMIKQYSISVAGLVNKLKNLSNDRRRDTSVSTMVVYIVSPFVRGRDAANAMLLRHVSPLLSTIPGTVGNANGQLGHSMSLPTTAWRLPAAHGNVLSLHVRIIPQEIMDRKLSTWMQKDSSLDVPLRPQLVKALAFSVFSSMRSKMLRADSGGGKESVGSGSAFFPEDQMSPMTPDFVGDCPPALSIAPHSPLATHPGTEDGAPHVQAPSGPSGQSGVTVDQSSALAPSFLHEPAVVLAGVGSHLTGSPRSVSFVLHLAYGFCKEASRYIFSWTDRRGELLDSASVSVLKNGTNGTRRRAFWYMWQRGQRWKLPYVDDVHITISKLGDMVEGEVEDWDVVLVKLLGIGASISAKSSEHNRARILRRFPCAQSQQQVDSIDGYIDHPTPATPAASVNPSTSSGRHNGHGHSGSPGRTQHDHSVKSVSLICLRDSPRERLIFDVLPEANRKEDFMVIAGPAFSGEKYVQGKALLGSISGENVHASEIDLVLHYGSSDRGSLEQTAGKWDGEKPSDIIRTVVENFHDLRFVGSPPCWPEHRWRSKYPLHLELVRNFRNSLRIAWAYPILRSSFK